MNLPADVNHALTRRRLLTLGGGIATAGMLAACGSNTGRGSARSTSGKGTGPQLNAWFHQYGEKGTQQALERYAREYQDAQINLNWKPGNYDDAVIAALQSDKAPDLFEYGNGPSADMIISGQVADLTDLFGDARSDFLKPLLDRFTYRGKIWAVPQVLEVQVLVYRKSMLDKAGVKPPRTMDELVAAARKLTTDKVKGLFLGNDGGSALMGAPMLRSAGLDLLTPDGGIGFDNPKAATALSVLRTLYTEKVLLLGAPSEWSSPDALTQGLTAMQFTGLWTFPDLTKAIGDDYGILPWPAMPGGKANVTIGAYGACVNGKGQNVDAAKKYVKWLWLDQVDKQVDWATGYGLHIPARSSLSGRSDKLKSAPAADAVKLAHEKGFVQAPLLWTPKCGTAFQDTMSRIIKDGADPAAELDALKTVVQAEVKRVSA